MTLFPGEQRSKSFTRVNNPGNILILLVIYLIKPYAMIFFNIKRYMTGLNKTGKRTFICASMHK
jgi:hypothetical protein